MTPTEALHALLDPRGRVNRKGLVVVAVVLLNLQLAAAGWLWATGHPFTGAAALAIKVAFLWLGFVAAAKRLHDMDISAWRILWAVLGTLAWTLAVAIGLGAAFGLAAIYPGQPLFIVYAVLGMGPVLAATVWIHFAKGTPGANRFGPVPEGLGFSGPGFTRVKPAPSRAPAAV